MSETDPKPISEEDIAKLKNSRSRYAGWLTRSVDQYGVLGTEAPSDVLEALRKRIAGQLTKLQAAHDRYIAALTDDDAVDEAEDWMTKYFDKATKCMTDINARAREARKHVVSPESHEEVPENVESENPTNVEPNNTEARGSDEPSGTLTASSSSASIFTQPETRPSIDGWIDELVIGKETTSQVPTSSSVNLSEAVMRLETERDLPKVELPVFDGSALMWPRFIEQFFAQVHSRSTLTDSRRMDILQSHVKGEAKSLIEGLGYSGRNYAQTLKELKFAFGHRIAVARAYVNSVVSGNVIANGDSSALRKFYIAVRDCISTLQQMNYMGELTSGDVLQRALRRIPNDKRSKWNEYICNISHKHEPTLFDLKEWLKQRVEAEFCPYSIPVRNSKPSSSSNSSSNPSQSSFTTLNSSSSRQAHVTEAKNCPACSGAHHLSRCEQYTSKTVNDRYEFVKSKRLCFNCFHPRHRVADCTSTVSCKVGGCSKRHHTSLHRDRSSLANGAAHNNNLMSKNSVYFQVLPVIVKGQNGRFVETYALLDSASDISLVHKELAEELGLRGQTKRLTVNTLSSPVSLKSANVCFAVQSRHDLDSRSLWIADAWTMDGIFNCPPVRASTVEHLEHLKDLNISNVQPHEVRILIGANIPQAHLQLEVREGRVGEPVAIKTLLGWCIMGVSSNDSRAAHSACVNLTASHFEDLDRQIENFWRTESFGVAVNLKEARSVEDLRAMDTLQKGTQFLDGHFTVPMLWKNSNVNLPDDRQMAEKRFQSLKKRAAADSDYKLKYSETMQGYIHKGYAKKMTSDEVKITSNRTWYLPHHSVINPRKPEKMRVVFDAAAVYEGVSLNSSLVTGPDLLNSLFGVLQRFRLRPVALVADITDMFYQVRVPEPDSDALRFLWMEDITSSSPPDVYKMLVHIFGAKDSPCCANFALRKVAADVTSDTLVSKTILQNFYVDDLLTAVQDVETAASLASEVTQSLAAKGFKLRKWMSSSKEVLSTIPEEDRAKPGMNLDLCDLPIEKALGVGWDVQTDSFVFKPTDADTLTSTKRGVISVVSAIFDPCGFLTPFTFIAKCLIQDLWRARLSWDDVIDDSHQERWKMWLVDLQHLSDLKIPRFHGLDLNIDRVELHVFCDASEAGFAAVAYLRMVGHRIRCSFLAAKSHVAPVKSTLTIPKLELQGAVMAVRLSETLVKELDVNLDRIVFWTDAMTVLKYIGNESRRWKIFVANRVSEIREKSDPSQWRHVISSMNPADFATRGMSAQDLKMDSMWFRGPAFLLLQEKCWPEQPEVGTPSPDDENFRKSVLVTSAHQDKCDNPVLKWNIAQLLEPQRFSSWYQLQRQTAWVLRAVRNFASGCARFDVSAVRSVRLTSSEMKEAEILLIRRSQMDSFADDYRNLSNGEEIDGRSSLRSLTPFFDSTFQVLRVGGRLEHSDREFEAKHQLLLPYNHHVTKLLVRNEHLKLAHIGPEQIVASLRTRFWPVKCRILAKQCVRECFDCRRRSAKPQVPLMSDLPRQRVQGSTRPFDFTGVDYFGPLTVKRARSHLKKWGCLFTCLVTRSVHLELADSLEADDFILVLRSFIGRRGKPSEIFCDNGKNFVGASRELQEALQQLDENNTVHHFLLKSSIQWHFITPNAPHFGGAWERLVKSVKLALKNILKEQCVTETVLRTALIEVEDVINSRPLTHNSVDPEDFTALTPNHFLRMDGNCHKPPADFHASEFNSRRRWRHSQVLADHIWRRWLMEYLPSLTARRKWTKEERNFMVNDLVLLMDYTRPRGQWPLARVQEVFPSVDGRIRTVKIKTPSGTYLRPASKICLLEEAVQP
jgi:hypothetical protein